MRCFIAIEVAPAIRQKLAEVTLKLRRALRGSRGGIKWVEPDLIHLTLKFLGDIDEAALATVCGTIDAVALAHSGFELSVEGVGCFGKPARVVWVGINESPALMALQVDLEGRLVAAGFTAEERPFSAHLTLARIKDSAAGKDVPGLIGADRSTRLGSFGVDTLRVFRSELTPQGPIYTVIHTSKLNA
jgi:RNA 2',3'-cyclic 3'-phosphodiesterase